MPSFLTRVTRRVNALGNRRECPICRWRGFFFLPYGTPKARRSDAWCPRCDSLERHRLAYLSLREIIGSGHLTLHVAPEPAITDWLRGISTDYLSIDLQGEAMRHMSLTALELPDESRTLVYCSHVLEHIPDDRAAMREVYRVLRPGGIAVFQAPIKEDTTYEDPSITTEEGRYRAFMQKDHVRMYGRDLADRLAEVGFEVSVRRVSEFPADLRRRHSLEFYLTNEVFVASRPGNGKASPAAG